MKAGGSKAATMSKQPALAPSPQPRPAPTARALPSSPAAQGGQNWTPIRGQFWTPIDTWDIDANFQHDPQLKTEIEIRFISEESGVTRVELEHRRLDRFGDRR